MSYTPSLLWDVPVGTGSFLTWGFFVGADDDEEEDEEGRRGIRASPLEFRRKTPSKGGLPCLGLGQDTAVWILYLIKSKILVKKPSSDSADEAGCFCSPILVTHKVVYIFLFNFPPIKIMESTRHSKALAIAGAPCNLSHVFWSRELKAIS